ncbi:Ankyrin repeat [Tangfeifania diversioriginum]|uniref:Ankyrin repeat n=2 Tax=Tangfeifania diversioriginum TaxID=1168035 RepID=A0A1M6HNL5_9BACT|nr:Ankyrin repeat [Tangfeifania diversioriginum]
MHGGVSWYLKIISNGPDNRYVVWILCCRFFKINKMALTARIRQIQCKLLFLLLVIHSGNVYSQEEDSPVDSLQLAVWLSEAILDNDTLTADSLIAAGTDVNISIADGVTPLMYAAQEGNIYFIKKLVRAGANVNQIPDNEISALQSAIISDKPDAVEFLLENGATLNTKDYLGNTPVINAALNNNLNMARLLIRRGAQVNGSNTDGNTALHFAAAFGNDSMVVLLLNAGARPNKRDNQGFTPLMVATSENFNTTAELLVSYGVDLNAKNEQGFSALTIAILNGNAYLAEFFLLNGADGNHLSGEAKDHWYYSKGTGRAMKSVLRNYDVKRNLLPVFNDWGGGAKLGMLNNHLKTEVVFGVKETKYNFWVQAALGVTPFVFSTLEEIGNKKYQFWERDYWLAFEIDKYISFKKSYQTEFGIFAGAEAAYKFGTYRGTGFRPASHLGFLPAAGLFWRQGFVETKLGYKNDIFGANEAGEFTIQFHFYFRRM